MTTHLTKIWWDLNKHKLVEQPIPEAQIYKREWVGLTDEERDECVDAADEASINKPLIFWSEHHYDAIEAKLKEKNNG